MLDKQLFRLIGSHKKYIFITVALMVLGMVANIAITAAICWAIYLVIDNADTARYLYPLVTALLAIIVRYGSARMVGKLKDTLGRNVKKELRQKTYKKIVALGKSSAGGMSVAGLTQVSLEGIEQLDLYYSHYLPQLFFSLIAPLLLFGISVGINWRVAVVLLACVPIIPLSIVMVSKYAQKVFATYWGQYTSMGDSFLDSVQGLKELKIFQADERQHQHINESAEAFRRITMKVLVMQLASITIMDVVAFGGAGVGIALAINGARHGGNPILALFVILIAVDFFLPLRALGSAFHVAMNGASAGHTIITLLGLPEPVWGNEKVDSTAIKLDHITFSHDGTRDVLNDVSVEFGTTGMYAIVGESGCGKSTMVGLITGENRAQRGTVTIGGKSLETLSRDHYYAHLAVVSHDTYIFNTSIRANFQLAKAEASENEMYEALRQVNLDDFVRENGGLDKIMTEDANSISGGQRQRLALAINLVADKDIYIVDEATSNIDIESEAVIMRNIKALSKKKLVIVISHRLANVVNADTIYYMADGAIKESGSHTTLLRQHGGYAALYNTQKFLEEGYKEGGHYAESKKVS